MSSETYTAICLNAIDYRESDKLLTLYAKGKGKITATLRGCKSPKSKLKYAGSPLCLGEYEFNVTRGKYIVTGISDAELFTELWSDLDKFYIALSMLEVFNKFTFESEIYDDLFLVLLRGLNYLTREDDSARVLAFYLYSVAEIMGYAPCVDACVKCGDSDVNDKKFSLVEGGIVCKDCGKGTALTPDIINVMRDMENGDFEVVGESNYSKSTLLNIIFIFSKYFEQILGEKVRSLCQFLDNMV